MKENLLKKVIFLGKLPPPLIGPSVATAIILKSRLRQNFNLLHLDTSDHRSINKLGAFDLKNILLPFMHYGQLLGMIVRHWPGAVYIPSAQTTVAYARDIPFILIAKLFGRKVICHLRGGNFKNWYDGASAVTRWIVRWMQRLVDVQIVLGECLVEMFTPFMPREKIFVVPNGGDFPVEMRKENNVGSKPCLRMLFLANFIRSKGVLQVLHSSVEVFKEFPNVEYVFVGSWRDKETQLEFIRFLLEHPELPVTVLPPLKGAEKFMLLATADIFVFPTYYSNEGHPWCIVEAMASGLPVISTDHGAIRETVADGVNGYLVEKENTAAVTAKIRTLLGDAALRKKMGWESRRLYEERFTEECMVERMTLAFDSVLREK